MSFNDAGSKKLEQGSGSGVRGQGSEVRDRK